MFTNELCPAQFVINVITSFYFKIENKTSAMTERF